jgi:DNA-binding transcriptional LysR family regulator
VDRKSDQRSKSSIERGSDGLPVIRGLDGQIGLRELRALVAVTDTGSFRRAAEHLCYTQSAVSHQIAVLEAALGIPLFTRPGGRGAISLTAAGRGAYRHARRALAAVEAMAAEARLAGRPGPARIRVGAFRTAAAELLPAALLAFSEQRPDVEVLVSETTESQDLITSLAQGELDLAFVLNPQPDERVEVVPLVEDPWVILTPRDNPISDDPHPSFDVLDGARLVAWHLRWRTQAQLEELLGQRGINPVVVHRTDDNLALQRLVAVGLGHACVGRLAARSAVDRHLTWLEPREELVRRRLALCYPREREVSGAVMALVAAVRSQAGA